MNKSQEEWSFLGLIIILLIVSFIFKWYIFTIPIYILLLILALQWPNKTVPILIAISSIILVQTVTVIYMKFFQDDAFKFPPSPDLCPSTYYPVVSEGKEKCRMLDYYLKTDPKCPIAEKDFSEMNVCEKYVWAQNCDLEWMGITSNPSISSLCYKTSL